MIKPTVESLARHAGLAAAVEQTPPQLLSVTLGVCDALAGQLPYELILEHLVGTAVGVIEMAPDPQKAADQALEGFRRALRRMGLVE